jgi:hypothetical protein
MTTHHQACIGALAIALLFAPPVAATTPTPTGTPVFVPTPPGLFTLRGHVAAGPGCAGGLAGVTVSIPRFSETVTGVDGRFAFPDLPYGYYYLQFSPNCPLIPCYPDRTVFLDASGDVDIDVCRDDCPGGALLSIRAGAPGTLVDVSGRCDAARSETVVIHFDEQPLLTLTADADGVYGGTLMVPLDAVPDADHLVTAALGDGAIASAAFTTVRGAAPCVGDCNRDGVVTIDELLRGIRIALGLDAPPACYSMDASQNGVVAIEELVTAVQRALDGCRLPDLVPVEAHFSRCIAAGCYAADQTTRFMEVCITNQGDGESAAFGIVETTTFTGASAPPLAAGAQECVELPLVLNPHIEVDPGNYVLELDESNNTLETAIAAPTACDIVAPPCTTTPTPTVTQTPTPT